MAFLTPGQTSTPENLRTRLNALLSELFRKSDKVDRRGYYARRRQRLMAHE